MAGKSHEERKLRNRIAQAKFRRRKKLSDQAWKQRFEMLENENATLHLRLAEVETTSRRGDEPTGLQGDDRNANAAAQIRNDLSREYDTSPSSHFARAERTANNDYSFDPTERREESRSYRVNSGPQPSGTFNQPHAIQQSIPPCHLPRQADTHLDPLIET